MKHLLLILALITLFSCTSTSPNKSDPVNFKIWEITSFSEGDLQYIPEVIKVAYLIINLKTDQTFIHYVLSEEKTSELEILWKKGNKKLKLEKVDLVQEVKYKQSGSKLVIISVKTDYVIKGENTDKITDTINNIIYTERAGESSGIFTLLYRIWNPEIIQQIPFPELNNKDTFALSFNKKTLTATGDNTTIILNDDGIHKWIGY